MLSGRELVKILLFLNIPKCLSYAEHSCKVPHIFTGNVIGYKNMSTENKKHTPIPATHKNARCKTYPRNPSIIRFVVPDDKVSWRVGFPSYAPAKYTAPAVLNKPPWADHDISNEKDSHDIKFNQVDGDVDRTSFHGDYKVEAGVPQNPVGRTGMVGRGLLGRWGPNHAADPIVTRWKKENDKVVKHKKTNKPILQFIAIKRSDSGEWALPGGMKSPGEHISATLKREFGEETMNSLEAEPQLKEKIAAQVAKLFQHGDEIYCGYVDDPRNTDNAWMETLACNFHDESGESVAKFKLHAGDDAVGVAWTDVDSQLKLYASHSDFVKRTTELHKAHW